MKEALDEEEEAAAWVLEDYLAGVKSPLVFFLSSFFSVALMAWLQ